MHLIGYPEILSLESQVINLIVRKYNIKRRTSLRRPKDSRKGEKELERLHHLSLTDFEGWLSDSQLSQEIVQKHKRSNPKLQSSPTYLTFEQKLIYTPIQLFNWWKKGVCFFFKISIFYYLLIFFSFLEKRKLNRYNI